MSGLINFMQVFGGDSPSYADSIISYWNFDSDFTDQIGSNDLTANTIDTFITSGGLVNDCLENENGSFSRLKNTSPVGLNFGNGITDVPFSVSFWFNLDSTRIIRFLSKRENTSGLQEFQIFYFSDNTIRFQLLSNSSISNRIQIIAAQSLTTSTWHHLVCTYDGSGLNSGMNMYFNNSSIGIKSTLGTYVAMDNTGSELSVSGSILIGVQNLDGKMDEVAFFDKELSQAEVTELYNRGLAGTPLFP